MSNELATPTQAVKDIRSFLQTDSFKSQLALALPAHLTPDRFARVALTALTRTPKLMECTRESLLRCLMDCSSLGLEPNGRDAHLIPYENRRLGIVECTLIVDWKGLVSLARRSGDVVIFHAQMVHEHDVFSWKNGRVEHEIDWRTDRGKAQVVYSHVQFKDGSEDWEVLTVKEVDAVRSRSKSKDLGPWVTDYNEMAKKTAVRRHSKRLTLSPEFQAALEKDDDRYEERVVRDRSARSEPLNPFAGAIADSAAQLAPPENYDQRAPEDGADNEWDGDGAEGGRDA